ncbi:MAG TPA: pyruvate dehydrogenase complex E1 component subunit beta [Acidimicrobiia bacterium]|nr:pyruvate dehydrogenase complex E1 component subunit beta [Acidimicrobiia bacterium]
MAVTDTAAEAVTDRVIPFGQALNEALDDALARDPKVFLLGEDIADPAGGVLKTTAGLSTKYGAHRVRTTPISEQAIIGAAIGAALGGFKPVAEIMLMDFFAVCMDQVANHAAKLRYMSGGRTGVPITIRTQVGGGLGFGGQHSQSLEAWMAHIPGLKVVCPSTPADAKGLLTACIDDPDPCIFMETIGLVYGATGPVPPGHHSVPLGVADVKREGSDVTVVAWGKTVHDALAAAAEVEADGISVEVVDLRTIVPLDLPAVLTSVAKTRRALVVHNATRFCGVGAEIASLIHGELHSDLAGPVERIGAAYATIPFAGVLEGALFPSKDGIVARLRAMTG